MASALYPARQVEYRLAENVEAPAKSATAYRLVADKVDRSRVTRLARAFDLDGTVEGSPGGSMGMRSGGAVLSVDPAGITSWSYARNPEGSVSSGVAVACAPDTKCPAPPPPPTVPGLPSAAEAEAKARALLERAGIGIDGTVTSTTPGESTIRTVSFIPRIDGREVGGLVTSVGFGERGRVEYANGFLGTFEEVGDYPLVGMAEAVERLRSGFGGDVRAMAMPEDLPADSGTSGGSTGSAGSGQGVDGREPAIAPAEPAPGQPPIPPQPPVPVPDSLPPEIVEITGARVALQVAYPMCPGDPVYVVPAFAFEPEQAGTVVAVVDEELTGNRASGDARGDATEPCPGVRPEPVPMGKPEPAIEPAPPRPEDVPGSAPAGAPGSSGSSAPGG